MCDVLGGMLQALLHNPAALLLALERGEVSIHHNDGVPATALKRLTIRYRLSFTCISRVDAASFPFLVCRAEMAWWAMMGNNECYVDLVEDMSGGLEQEPTLVWRSVVAAHCMKS